MAKIRFFTFLCNDSYIKKTEKSFLNQNFLDFEWVIFTTESIYKKIYFNDERIKIHIVKEIPDSFTDILTCYENENEYEYLGIVTPGDIFPKNYVKVMYETAAKNSAEFCACSFNGNNRNTKISNYPAIPDIYTDKYVANGENFQKNFYLLYSPEAKIFKKDFAAMNFKNANDIFPDYNGYYKEAIKTIYLFGESIKSVFLDNITYNYNQNINYIPQKSDMTAIAKIQEITVSIEKKFGVYIFNEFADIRALNCIASMIIGLTKVKSINLEETIKKAEIIEEALTNRIFAKLGEKANALLYVEKIYKEFIEYITSDNYNLLEEFYIFEMSLALKYPKEFSYIGYLALKNKKNINRFFAEELKMRLGNSNKLSESPEISEINEKLENAVKNNDKERILGYSFLKSNYKIETKENNDG